MLLKQEYLKMADDYEVGYGRPPPHTRFKKGQSGNPAGRRRKKLTKWEIVRRVAEEPIMITINGAQKRVTAFEAAVRKTLMNVLSKGNVRDLERLFQLFEKYGGTPAEDRAADSKAAADAVMQKMLQIFDRTVPDDPPLVE